MTLSPSIQANLDLVVRAGTLIHTRFVDPDEELFAHDFVFHYVNPRLADRRAATAAETATLACDVGPRTPEQRCALP